MARPQSHCYAPETVAPGGYVEIVDGSEHDGKKGKVETFDSACKVWIVRLDDKVRLDGKGKTALTSQGGRSAVCYGSPGLA